jgi:hypothetical protein
MILNKNRDFCYRITHQDNFAHLLKFGLVHKNHAQADANFVAIGNSEIIDVRGTTPVRIEGYGNIGDYVPFYFTTRSIMLYNIITGYYAPKVPRREKDELIAIRCKISTLTREQQWFFTDGQANDGESRHYNHLRHLNNIDWDCIQHSNFSKSDGDYDRQRRYQAEFLVYNQVPTACIESINVYTAEMKNWAEQEIKRAGLKIPVNVQKYYFFD